MRLSINFTNDFPLNDEAGEFDIWYDEKRNDFANLFEFANTYKSKRINLRYRDGVDTKSARTLSAACDNVRYVLRTADMPRVDALRGAGCKFFFERSMPCRTMLELRHFVETLGVTDVYIADDLCYHLDEVSDYCRRWGVALRVALNTCQVTVPFDDKRIVFYRPQDMTWLGDYYDVAEFDLGEDRDYSFSKCKVLHRAYFEKEDWYMDLRTLVPSIPFTVMNRALPRSFGQYRATCGLRCLCRGANCHHCEQMISLMNALADKNIQLEDTKPIRKDRTTDTA